MSPQLKKKSQSLRKICTDSLPTSEYFSVEYYIAWEHTNVYGLIEEMKPEFDDERVFQVDCM